MRQPSPQARHHPRAHGPAPTPAAPGIPDLLLARPLRTETEAQDEAQEEAEWRDYDVRRCRKCFHTPQALDWRHRRARERLARGDWLSRVPPQPSRRGVRSSRSR